MGTHRRPRPKAARRWQVTLAGAGTAGVLGALALVLGVPASGSNGVLWTAGNGNHDTAHSTAAPGRTPKGHRAASRSARAAGSLAFTPDAAAADSESAFDGVPAVGALFETDGNGKLQSHFCTASVVDSPGRDLLVTAAHCVGGGSRSGDLGIAFAPGYHDGQFPYGVWTATRFVADSAWSSSSDPDHDVGFLHVTPAGGGGRKIEDVTGAVALGVGRPVAGTVRVIGYPVSLDRPITCQNKITQFSARQMQFDCPGYEGGTSGGPFIAPDGSVIGVIGGYQEGGLQDDVSYSTTFTGDVRDLYATAIS
jgi:V8-like Glu-specific endopeptidase